VGPVEVAVVVPVGGDDEGVAALGEVVDGVVQAGGEIGVLGAGVGDGDGVVGLDMGAAGVEVVDEGEGGGVAEVVGAAFEGEAEEADGGAAEDWCRGGP